jgi:hypothetical protein
VRDYIVLLITTLHGGLNGTRYLLRTALKVPYSAMDAAGIDDIYAESARPWLLERLPLHARGEGIVHIDEVFEVAEVPEPKDDAALARLEGAKK